MSASSLSNNALAKKKFKGLADSHYLCGDGSEVWGEGNIISFNDNGGILFENIFREGARVALAILT